MIQGARRLPTRHLSIRVPWHDLGWDGRVCTNPRGNTHCIALPRIGDTRDDDWEASVAGKTFDVDGGRLPACAAERGAFMAGFGYVRRFEHPYSGRPSHLHFRRTTYRHAPFSAAAIPFGWMMLGEEGTPAVASALKLDFQSEREPEIGFKSAWVQERSNQLALLDTFFGAIEPEASLVFFYAKKTPLTEDPRRVIVGIGRVRKVGPSTEYAYEDAPANGLRSMVWERDVEHSIRPGIGDGFLLPYHELLRMAASDPDLDLASFVLHAPEDHWNAFSMGAEHVSHDQAVSALISAAAVVSRYEQLLDGDWSAARDWIDAELNRLWRLRGSFPGLGSALTALGLQNGTLLAHEIGRRCDAQGVAGSTDPWAHVDAVLSDPSLLPPELGASVGPVAGALWKSLRPDRLALLKLLSRFEISSEQAVRWWVLEERVKAGIQVDDAALLANPYLVYELDRGRLDPVPVRTIDRGIFPGPHVGGEFSVPSPSACTEPTDPRRVRAFMVDMLEKAASQGHTLLPQDWLVSAIRDADIAPPCPVGSDWVAAFESGFAPTIEPTELRDGGRGWQLARYAAARDLIATRIRRRVGGTRHKGDHDWRAKIDEALGGALVGQDLIEEAARDEKATALEELYRSRGSVLIGPAGTGKTTLLMALLSLDQVSAGGVLLLAPTGKARVQMQKKAGDVTAYTLAQFLLGWDRYDAVTGTYLVTGALDREAGFGTVVIDEASMLTEDQLAATLDALDPAIVQRLILVGDPRQLPPIGAGRPFFDIIGLLRSTDGPLRGLAELTVVRRQAEGGSEGRDDVLLSRWFSGQSPDPGADEVWDRLVRGTAVGVRAVQWTDDEDLHVKLQDAIAAHVRVGRDVDLDDETAFGLSLGGTEHQGRAYFWPSKDGDEGRVHGAAEVESWQILAPMRGGESGVDGLNRWMKRLFRTETLKAAEAEKSWQRRVPAPMGAQKIVWGDKVINVANGRRRDVWPKLDRAYLANGEIGLVVGQFKGSKWKLQGAPWKLEVEFSTQLGHKFGFERYEFGADGEARLELAYALTIHKSQGSEFGTTFVVLPNPCRPLSRELLYTALTRQQQEVVLLHQGDIRELMELSGDARSETARRWTNLFVAPDPIDYGGGFLERGLIHRTTRGELVRSKSEVIVADILAALDLPYSYERPFVGTDGAVRYPDFTVEDAETGRTLLIEHLGMLNRPDYRRRWARKEAWYRSVGVGTAGDPDAEVTLLTTSEVDGLDAAEIRASIIRALGI
ncbi:hypothetical protein QE363_000685 [Sphingomonas sp. SORGH_AS870]|uniref:AAA family ATPase n=1 Tax=Sphingomonas sp. SORGH_AS_0870 TaxID=3041801 RepID=UPI002864AA0D|nr:AAA family ATPase [Sphingomonas sp. SORGH_AS_0870]MDR6144892.1 hypothetical protein [Sphingomonas sp. SORGH_AS_0870]